MQKKISFKNNKGQRLVGIIHIPKGKGPFPAVIMCHGFRGRKESMQQSTLATSLANSDIVALRFDFVRDPGASEPLFENLLFSQMLKDLKSSIDFIIKQKIVDKNRIGITGHSLGGQLVLTYAPTDKRVKAIADMAGVVNRARGKTRLEENVKHQEAEAKRTGYLKVASYSTNKHYRLKYRFWLDLKKQNTIAQIKKIKVPTIIIHGTKDESVPIEHSRVAFKLLKQPKALHVIKGVKHNWKSPADKIYRKKINKLIADWFKKYL